RVRNLKFIGNRYEFTTIPVAGSLFHGKPIGHQCDGEDGPATDIVDLLKIHEKQDFGKLKTRKYKKPDSPAPCEKRPGRHQAYLYTMTTKPSHSRKIRM